ncbi:helix-turn-helix domain-containing protein [Chitinilyticum litopenaei]|uniref:helix-turn-helix domain-containing protein n=1 Tax=Chitinilyticum litopenaei TaxID=1121276 RepID=UPI0003F4B83B|nr:AraC family transcriptional regulator [Chitinilyticum litopenaei]
MTTTFSLLPHHPGRLARVLAHIDANLDAPLELAELAELAHFSQFHFQRLFTAALGTSPYLYVQRRRLERAASQLRGEPRRKVVDIALANGYQSQSGFCKAFRRQFGVSTRQWRAQARQAA